MIWIYTTMGSEHRDLLGRCAREAVEGGLAYCVQILGGGVESYYRWEGEVQCDQEVGVIFKTVASKEQALRDWLCEHHPYQVPGIWKLQPQCLSEGYRRWAENLGESSL